MRLKTVVLSIILVLTMVVSPLPALAEEATLQPGAAGVSWYVSPTGNDSNNGLSPDTPLKTPNKVVEKTNPGDTVYFRGGVYDYYEGGTMLLINRSGEPGAYITYTNYPGETPIFTAHSGWNHIAIWASYVKLEGLTVKGISSEELIARGQEIYDRCLAAKKDPAVQGPTIYEMGITNTNGVTVGSKDMLSAEGAPKSIHHVEIRNCIIRNCPGGGLGATLADYVTFENNEIYNNCWPTIYASSGISVLGLIDFDDNTDDYKVVIRNNKVYDNVTWVPWLAEERHSDGNGIILDSIRESEQTVMPYKGRVLVANNLCYNNGGSGIHSFVSDNVDVVNNTLYNNSRNPNLDYAQMFASRSNNIRFVNNIVYGRTGKPLVSTDSTTNAWSKGSNVEFINNLYFNGEPPEDLPSSGDRVANPEFVDLANYDFHLRPTSQAIDHGVSEVEQGTFMGTVIPPNNDLDGNKRPRGGGYDIGAYESQYTYTDLLRESTFETDDPNFGSWPPVGQVFKSYMLDYSSQSQMRLVNEGNNRKLEITTFKDTIGGVGLPFDVWSNSVFRNQYVFEAELTPKDKNTDITLMTVSGDRQLRSPILCFASNGYIYSRSGDTGHPEMVYRWNWKPGITYKIRVVVKLTSRSYDLYLGENGGKEMALVRRGPLEKGWVETYVCGLSSFYFLTGEGPHNESVMLVDNIRISGLDAVGDAPVVSPGGLVRPEVSKAADGPKIYYVGPNGKDSNNGSSPETAFATTAKAVNLTNPGDTVYFLDGEYQWENTTFLSVNRSGLPDAPITYRAAPGAKPIIRAKNMWNCIEIFANYIIIDGLTLVGDNDNITLEEGMAVYNGAVAGALPSNAGRTNTNAITVNGRIARKRGIEPVHDVTVRNCDISKFPSGGLSSLECDAITFADNRVYSNCWYTIYAPSGISLLNNIDWDGKAETDIYRNFVTGNVCYDNETKVPWIAIERISDGNGIIIDSNNNTTLDGVRAYGGRTLVANNICFENGGSGIHGYESSHLDIINNTVYNNSRSEALNYAQLYATHGSDINIMNNIAYAREGEAVNQIVNQTNAVNYDYNLYYNGRVNARGEHDIVANPEFVDLSAYDFRLKANSPALGAGIPFQTVKTDFFGHSRTEQVGMGAIEESATSGKLLTEVTLTKDGQPAINLISGRYQSEVSLYGVRPVLGGLENHPIAVYMVLHKDDLLVWSTVQEVDSAPLLGEQLILEPVKFEILEDGAYTLTVYTWTENEVPLSGKIEL